MDKKPSHNSRYTRFGYLAEFKYGFVLGRFGESERLRIFNPKPRVAPGRYRQVVPKLRRKKSLENTHLFTQKNFRAEV
ncbi:hypothetical protein H4V97_002829 [Flavobacterium sp. CG_23.5]|nr:hypothetical protein [Flavobacterium sp. CG_23.5]